MSHSINYRNYYCSMNPKQILKDLNRWAFNPQETSKYYASLKCYDYKIFKNCDETYNLLKKNCKHY